MDHRTKIIRLKTIPSFSCIYTNLAEDPIQLVHYVLNTTVL